MALQQLGWRTHWVIGGVAGFLALSLGLLGCKDKPAENGSGGGNKSAANLEKLGIALKFWHEDFHRLPPPEFTIAMSVPPGTPRLSWRVGLLPYIEQLDLYKQFKLDEPWDSPHNKKLIPKMPKLYAAPGVQTKEPYTTHYQVFACDSNAKPRTPFPRVKEATILAGTTSYRHIELADGLASTILIIEAAEPVIWTKPDDLNYEADQPLPPLGFLPDRIHALFADGKVRAIKKGLGDKLLLPAILMDDGEKPGAEVFIK